MSRSLFPPRTESSWPKELWVIPGADHGGTLAAAGSAYKKREGEFFEKSMK